jgi:fructose-1-phosphate kinase PfkB-like protein
MAKRKSKKVVKQSEGLGDTVEKVLKATGIDKVAKFILGEDCGCDDRKATLNRLFPYQKP